MYRPAVVVLFLFASAAFAQDSPRDRRYDKPIDLNGYFPFTPPKDLNAWRERRELLREQILVSQGLWPMPPKTKLSPVISGTVVRDGYIVKNVSFASLPGHYVTGNLYIPTGRSGKLPAILSPHGHWKDGRFYDANDKEIDKQLKLGAEQTREGAKHPLQARCAQLARMGCVVFHYDMVGYADSRTVKHREGFKDVDAELWSTTFMGLQTWNTIRALDFLASLPNVDAERIGVTGASGGGTQTFILGAIDDRPAAAFPAVMVGTAMQGGCVCENASYLRVGTGNVEIAGLFAPKPLGMVAANDWTKDIETRGFPELKALYRLYGKWDDVSAKTYLQFPHNYNQASREVMYNFFNKHLKLGQKEPIVEQAFVPATAQELSAWDDSHPYPADAAEPAQIRKYLKDVARKQIDVANNKPGDDAIRKIATPALRAMIGDTLPGPKGVVDVVPSKKADNPDWIVRDYVLSRRGQREAVRAQGICGKSFAGNVLVWVHPDGVNSLWKDGQPHPVALKWLEADGAILAVDCLHTGADASKKRIPVDSNYAGFTFGYNRPLLSERVHDILTTVALAKHHSSTRSISIVGFDEAGPWTLLAAALCDGDLKKTAVDLNHFRFEAIETTSDPMILPGALRYGGMPTFARLCTQFPLLMHNAEATGCENHAQYAPPGQVRVERQKLDPAATMEWLLAK
ncbi:MAG: acetylxylan esterase [Planctomycetota bacterium]